MAAADGGGDSRPPLSARDAELLLSYLTAPYLRIPLLLQFFADQQRLNALASPRMQQVLMNLLHNAIKFTPPDGRINVFAERRAEAEDVLFCVEDTGVGIPREDLPRIFERFFKSDRARSGGGTGLGLAISKHLVEAHGGRIWAESELQVGSKFYFTLPLSPKE